MSYDSRETSVSTGQPFELYKFLTETETWLMTSGDVERTYQGQVYQPTALVRTSTSQSTEVKGGHVKIRMAPNNEIAQMFVATIPSTPLFLTIYRGHDGEPQSEVVVVFTGRVLSAQFTTDDLCELDCAPESELLERRIASTCFQKQCNHILFDAGCGLHKELWRVSGVLTAVSPDGLTLTSPAFVSRPNGWWNTGYIEYGTDRRMVISHVGETVKLMTALNGLGPGVQISIYPGCDRSYEVCQQKFNNGANFNGWQWIPSKNPFSSGVA